MSRTMRHRQGGPPLPMLGGLSLGFLLISLIASTAIAGRAFPSPFSSSATIIGYVTQQHHAIAVQAVLQFASAIPLALYAATVHARLHRLGVRAPGATIALVGGVLAASALLVSALFQWELARSATRGDVSLLRALHDLTFLLGGPGHVVPLGLLIAGVAVPGWLGGLLPRTFALAGLGIAMVCELSTLSLVSDSAVFLLPLGRFPGLVWLIAAGVLLPWDRRELRAADRDLVTV
jgi:hypothetical protein